MSPGHERDRGVMLPIVLVVTVVMSLAVIAIANYVSTDLSYGRVTIDRANRLAAADAVMNYGIDQLKLRNAGCLLSTGVSSLPGLNSPVNGAASTLTCQRVGGGIGDIQAWAAVMTGIGVPTNGANAYLLSTQSGNAVDKILGGPVYMDRVTNQSFAFGPTVKSRTVRSIITMPHPRRRCCRRRCRPNWSSNRISSTDRSPRKKLGPLRRSEQTQPCRTSRFSHSTPLSRQTVRARYSVRYLHCAPQPRQLRLFQVRRLLLPQHRLASITRSSPPDFLIRPSSLQPSCPTPPATRPLPPTRTRCFRIWVPPSTWVAAATSR